MVIVCVCVCILLHLNLTFDGSATLTVQLNISQIEDDSETLQMSRRFFPIFCVSSPLLEASQCLSPVSKCLSDEDQYLLRRSSPALDQDSPCGQHLLLSHLEQQDKEQLQRTLTHLENENRFLSSSFLTVFVTVSPNE